MVKTLFVALRGSRKSGVRMLWLVGILGAGLGLAAHLGPFHTIDLGSSQVVGLGYTEPNAGLGLLALAAYAALMLANSVYAALPALLFLAYMLEQLIGTNLLRYMPLESTRLAPPLYLFLPVASVSMLLGSLSPILSKDEAQA